MGIIIDDDGVMHKVFTKADMLDMLEELRSKILEYIDDLDIAAEICDVFDKYKAKIEPQESEEKVEE